MFFWLFGFEVFLVGFFLVLVLLVIIVVVVEVVVMIEVLFLVMVVVLVMGMGLVVVKMLVRRSVKKMRYLVKKLVILNVCNFVF